MYIGHYGIGFALKKGDKKISLGLLFLAVSFIDLLHYFLTLIGVEAIEFVPGYTQWVTVKGINPITHSLAGMAFWSLIMTILVLGIGLLLRKDKTEIRRAALILGLGVFSHFFCDLLVHAPDLPLAGAQTARMGFSLWNFPVISNLVEIGMFLAGMGFYLKTMGPTSRGFKIKFLVFGIILIAYHLSLGLLPPMESVFIAYSIMLVTSLLVVTAAHLLDSPRKKPPHDARI